MLTESTFLELYNRQQASGLNVKDFCLNEGINKSTFYYWQKKLQKSRGSKDFIPLVVKSSQSGPKQKYTNGYHPGSDHGHMDENVFLELVYPNGTKLRINIDIDLSHLRALIHLYD